jgi:hypothetical protein
MTCEECDRLRAMLKDVTALSIEATRQRIRAQKELKHAQDLIARIVDRPDAPPPPPPVLKAKDRW